MKLLKSEYGYSIQDIIECYEDLKDRFENDGDPDCIRDDAYTPHYVMCHMVHQWYNLGTNEYRKQVEDEVYEVLKDNTDYTVRY